MIVVSKIDDAIVAEDRFAEDFSKPAKDDLQNAELLSTVTKDSMFQAIVRRPMATCDVQDLAIRDEYPHMVLYAFGADGDWTFQYHGTANRGVSQIVLTGEDDGLQNYYDEVQNSNPDHLLIHFNNYHIPTEDRQDRSGQMVEGSNQYKCMAVPIQHVTNLTPPFDIIAGSPISSKYLHHFVNSACQNDPRPNSELAWGQDQENDIYNCGMGAKSEAKCSSIPGYAAGSKKFVYGPDKGTQVPGGTNWFVFNTHFYNPTMDTNAYDSSGYDYIVTTKLRPSKIAMLWAGMDLSMRIPFGHKRAHYAQHCPAEAVEQIFSPGQDTVQIDGVMHHLHQRGTGAFTYIVRDGHRIPLVMQEHFDYNFQGSVPASVTLKRGDAIEVHCTYDTSEDTSDVQWGERTQDEMCISVIGFTPAPPTATLFRCVGIQREPFGHMGILMVFPSDGEMQMGYRYNQTEVNTNVAYPVPDSNGKYDLPWGKPLDPKFSDYECKVGKGPSSKGPPSTPQSTSISASATASPDASGTDAPGTEASQVLTASPDASGTEASAASQVLFGPLVVASFLYMTCTN